MQLNNLIPKTKNKKTMIVGRGGKRGKTSGRGGKGQTARAGNKRRPEIRDFIKRIPKLRGRGKQGLRSIQNKPSSSMSMLSKQSSTQATQFH
jgi:ribosomal protein L15